MLLWAADGERALPAEVRREIADRRTQVFVSAASAWEIAIKQAKGRLKTPGAVGELADESGFFRLEITFEHGETAAQLPPHHRDPFDRILVAQAQIERLTLVTADRKLARYDIDTLDLTRG